VFKALQLIVFYTEAICKL